MANTIWFPNIREVSTGTTVATSRCLDVSPKNTAGTPLYVSDVGSAGTSVLETRFHDAASTNINDSAGAFVEIETAAALASNITVLKVNSTIGEPLAFGAGADAGAAASNIICVLNRGEGPSDFPVSLSTGDRIWVRSLTTTSVTSGELTVNLVG